MACSGAGLCPVWLRPFGPNLGHKAHYSRRPYLTHPLSDRARHLPLPLIDLSLSTFNSSTLGHRQSSLNVTLSVRLFANEIKYSLAKHPLAICKAKNNVNDINQGILVTGISTPTLSPTLMSTSIPTEKSRKTLDIIQMETMKLSTSMD
jgi:hypothetical protein